MASIRSSQGVSTCLRTHQATLLPASVSRILLAAGIKGFCGLLGPFGAIAGEFLTQFVPRQRLDRLQDFIEQLNDEVGALRDRFEARLQEPPFASLTEESFVAAVQTPSDVRRRELAALLRHAIESKEASLSREHAMLRLLADVADAEIVILRAHSFSRVIGDQAYANYVRAHDDVLSARPPDSGSTAAERERWTLYLFHEDRLVGLGLLRELEGIAKSSVRPRRGLTELGRLLLEAIETAHPIDAQKR